MIEQIREAIAASPPLLIREAMFSDPTLSIAGDGWALSTSSAWRVVRDGVLEFGWSDAAAQDHVWELCGLTVVSVEAQGRQMGGDPAFGLSNGQWLELFSDQPIDPWSLQLPGMTFVGSPSDPSEV